MATVQVIILSEEEAGPGWTFVAEVQAPGDRVRRHEVHLSWADYNRWSPGGSDRPESIAAAVLRYLYEWNLPERLPERFDASTVRRADPEADQEIPRRIEN